MPKKKTHEDYIEEVARINSNIEVVDKYAGAKTKILHRCKIDNCEWMATPSNILQGTSCPECGKKKKKTHDEYVKEVERINPNIEVVGQYVNNCTKILHRCRVDGYEWITMPHSVLSGYMCPRCINKERYTQEGYVKKLYEINPNIEVVGKYIDAHTKILHRCKVDGYEWFVTPNNVLDGKGCPKCGIEILKRKLAKSHDEYMDEILIINKNIKVIGKYINSQTPIMHKCLICGYEWEVIPSRLLSGGGCPACYGKMKKTQDKYIQEVFSINPNIEVMGEYINANTPILHRCKIDGHEWYAKPHNILCGKGCPKCNESKGERNIASWLCGINIYYESQKRFDNCRDKNPLPFDFYLPDYNICIEYQGIQHYKPIGYFGGQKTFESQVLRDNIKKDYCKDNGILLFEIPYYSDLDEELIKLHEIIKTINVEKEVVA